MARPIEVKCPGCGLEWTEDLDEYQAVNTIYRFFGKRQPKTRVESYRFSCKRCGDNVVAEAEIEE